MHDYSACGPQSTNDALGPPASGEPLASRIVAFWTRDYLAQPAALAALGALFAGYLTYLFLLGPAPSTLYGNDAFLYLDGGWRLLNGQAPNHDFYLSLGPIIYMVVAAGLRLAHNSASGLMIGFLSFGAVIAVFAFLISRPRMTAAGSILFSTFILLLCTAPMPLGAHSSLDLSYAMIYNRFGYGLLSILFVAQLLAPQKLAARARQEWFAGMVSGAILPVLFFLKISYFGVGAAFTLLTTLAFADLRTVRRLLATACGLVPITLAMLAFLRFDVGALGHDLADTIRARSARISHFGIADVFDPSTASLLALAVALCFLGLKDAGGRNRIWLSAAAIYTILAEALFVRTNSIHAYVFPLYAVFTFILLADLGNTLRTGQRISAAFAAALIVIGLSLMAQLFFDHIRSLALLTTYKTNTGLRAAAYRVEGEHLRSLAFYDRGDESDLARQENGRFYTAYLNDGIDLLKKYSTSSDIVASLSFHDPFPYALLRRPPRAGSTWLLLDNNISAGHMLSDARMFGDATVVMTPKYLPTTHATSDELLFREYGPYLLSHFTFVAESDHWRLYRRRE
jgi:hypothetical protein